MSNFMSCWQAKYNYFQKYNYSNHKLSEFIFLGFKDIDKVVILKSEKETHSVQSNAAQIEHSCPHMLRSGSSGGSLACDTTRDNVTNL